MRRFFRITYYLGGIILFVLIAVIVYTQTRSFKTYLRNTLLLESRSALNGQLQLGIIEGNLITGFTIDSISICDDISDFFSAERIDLKYDPFGFLFNRVAVSIATIVRPRIHIYRSIDGTWNVDRFIKPAPADTNPSVWNIDIKRLELANAELIFTDSLMLHQRYKNERPIPPDSVIDYAQVHLHALSFIASAQIQKGTYAVKIRNLSTSIYRDKGSPFFRMDKQLTSQIPVFSITHLGGDFLLAKNEVSARNVRIETSNSLLFLNAGLKDIDIRHLSSVEGLKTKIVDLSLSANSLDTKELKQFLYPWVDFLDGELKLQVKANGPFGKLNIEQLAIQMPQTSIQLQGQIRNLHHTRDLEMSVYGNDNFISPQDILDRLPGLKIPDLTSLGPITYSLTYEGRPLDFQAQFIGNTSAGNISVDGKMKINKNDITYTGTAVTSSIALGIIFQDNNLSSNLNGKVTIDGMGFNPHTMTGLAKVEIDSSLINGVPLGHSVLVFDIADGLLRSHASVSMGSGSYELSSQLRFLKQDSTNYSLIGKIRSLDLAELLKNKQYESGLSFDITATGSSGKTGRSDSTVLYFYRSAFETETFETAEAKIIFNSSDSSQSILQITSTIADLSVNGHFTPASFIATWKDSYQLITEAVAYRFRNLDSLQSFNSHASTLQKFRSSSVSAMNPVDAQYCLRVKDFRPVGIFLHAPLQGHGMVEGNIAGDPIAMQISGKMDFAQLGIRTGTDTLAAESVSANFYLNGIRNQNMFEDLSGSLETKLQHCWINTLPLNHVDGRLSAKINSSDFEFSALVDSTAWITFAGSSQVQAQLMDFIIPELKIDIGEYSAKNTDTVKFTLGQNGIRIQSLSMAHETEETSIWGQFSPTGISDLNITLNNFLLSNLRQILHRGPYAQSSTQLGGLVQLAALFRGNFAHPNIVVDLKAEGVRAEDILQNKKQVLGKVESRITYFEHVLTLLLKFMSRSDDPQATPDLLLSGSLPYDLALTHETPHKLEGEVDILLQSPGLNLKFLDPFIPEISNLNGMMACNMRMKGPIDAPVYEGSMAIQNASFLFDPIGIRYIMNGDLVPTGDRIQLEQFTIKNDPQERFHAGTINLVGDFTLLGLKLKQFNLLAQGDLKVMSENKRAAGQQIYGNLFIATGNSGLFWQGDLSASTVKGEIFVRDAQLILPPEREIELKRTSSINTIFKDDTSKVDLQIPESSENIGRKISEQPVGSIVGKKESFLKDPELHGSSFLDGISYDISIETQGPTQLRFVFNTQTSEELFADLQGRLYFNKAPGISRLSGQVEVGNRSYYNFIKKFEATGKLLFTGDVLNPELDVTATYQGTHRALNNISDTTNTQSPGVNQGDEGKDQQVLVTLQITGTRNEPKTKITLQTKTQTEKDWQAWKEGDEEANAISYIISGQFRDELTDQQRMGLIGTNVGLSLASSMLTGPLSEAARKATYGVVQSVDMLYYGGQFGQAADLRVTGQVGEAVIRAGGRVFTGDFSNTNVSVELPMSFVIGVDGLRNLILTIERRVESIQSAEEQRRASNGARLFYRITF